MNRIFRCVAFAAVILASAPVDAAEDLRSFLGALPDPDGPPVFFNYFSPPGGFGAQYPTFANISDTTLAQALVKRRPDALSGIDFATVMGVLTFGQPPQDTTVLFGGPGFSDGVERALLARGFAQSSVDALPVFAAGDDYAVDLTQMGNGDPLGSDMGKAQRVALGQTMLVRTAGWPEMRAALAAMTQPADAPNLWQATLDGISSVSDGLPLFSVMGFTPDPAIDMQPQAAKLSLLAIGGDASQITLLSAAPYDSEAQARTQSQAIVDSTGDSRPPGSKLTILTEPVGDLVIGIIKIEGPNQAME